MGKTQSRVLMLFIIFYIFLSGTNIFLGIINYSLGNVDTALYQTSLWQAGQLMNPKYHFWGFLNYETFTQNHIMPMGFIYGLFYRIFPSMHLTGVLYIVVYSLSTILIYKIVNTIMKNNLYASFFAIAHNLYYFKPTHHFYPLDDFAVLFISGGIYYFLRNNLKIATLFFVIVMMHKEYYGLAISSLFFSLIMFSIMKMDKKSIKIWYKNSSNSLFLLSWFTVGILWFIISLFIMIRTGGSEWANDSLFQTVGGVLGPIINISNFIHILFERLLHPINIYFIIYLLIPFCFFSLVGLEYLFAIVPIILILVLTDDFHATKSAVGHYTIWLSPFITTSAAFGLKRMLEYFKSIIKIKILVLICLMITIFYYSYSGISLHAYYIKGRILENYAFVDYKNDIRNIIHKIPSNSKLAADDRLLPFLADRKYLYSLSMIENGKPDFILRDYFQKHKLEFYRDIYGANFLKTYSIPTTQFYNSKNWDKINMDQQYSGKYELVIRSGAIALYRIIELNR